MEFLDERFPHPPLMPVDPVSRGRTRMTLRRIQKDWDNLLEVIEGSDAAAAEKAKKELAESLTVVSPIFEQKPFFMNDEFSLMDCAVVPILWRLPSYGIDLPASAKLMNDYAQRMFELDNFQASLSETEREMR
jgi:RNA polymerase-associated protein